MVRIELTPKAEKILLGLQTLPQWALQAIAEGMDEANRQAVSHIQKDHLSGTGPFPPSENRLGVKTNHLRAQVWASPAVVKGETVESSIGDPVKYAELHEFGGRIHIPARKGKVRLRTDAQGRLMRQVAHSALAVFAKDSHPRVKEVAYESEAYDVTMPERAPFRTGIQDTFAVYGRIVGNALVKAWDAQT